MSAQVSLRSVPREPLSQMCAGRCGRQLLVADETGWNVRPGKGKMPAYSETHDPQTGRRLVYCRWCTEEMYRLGA